MDTIVSNQGQARELAKVEPAKRVEVLEKASESGPVTAKKIQEAAHIVAPRKDKAALRESLDLPPEKSFTITAEMLKTDMKRAVKYAPKKKAALLRCAAVLEQTAKRFKQLAKKSKE